jgi:hypothetical protein
MRKVVTEEREEAALHRPHGTFIVRLFVIDRRSKETDAEIAI